MEIDKDTIKRAWQSKEFRESLAPAVRDAIPAPPQIDDSTVLSDEDLKAITGGATPEAESNSLGDADGEHTSG